MKELLSAFPNQLVGYSHGIWYAKAEAVGKSSSLPQAPPYTGAFAPLCPNREWRLPRSLRQHGYETEGYCLLTCPR